MYGFKNYKKRKSKKYPMILIVFFCILFTGTIFLQSGIKSDDIDEKEENDVLNKVVDYVVAISSKNEDNNIWGSGVIISKMRIYRYQ